jgi:tetratricopeptide (TPR) repeat protein
MTMFLSRFFKKDPDTLVQRGEKALSSGDCSRAHHEFSSALELLGGAAASGPLAERCRSGMSRAMNALAEMNIEEAGHQLRAGNHDKAMDHLELARSQATDEVILARIAELSASSAAQAPAPAHGKKKGHSCGGCGSHDHGHHHKHHHGHGHGHEEEVDDSHFAGDRFELLVAALPDDLPQRYRDQGEEFARAYVLADEERYAEALPILGSLPGAFDNDVVLYEIAVIYHRQGRIEESEALFRRVLSLNPMNSLGNLALFHLLADLGRYQEGAAHLEGMLARGVMKEQTTFMLGDLKMAMGQEEEGAALLGSLLSTPLAKESAKRLVPYLQEQGRDNEAKQLAKQHLKGCC